MKKDKVFKVANISMNTEAYNKFVSLSYEQQLEKVYNGLDPKDMSQAEKALKNVPNVGNIGDRVSKEAAKDATTNRAGNGKNNPEKSVDNKS